MTDIVLLDDGNRFICLDEGVLTTWRNSHIVDSMRLTPDEAVTLAEALLEWGAKEK